MTNVSQPGFAAIPRHILRDTTLPPGARFLYAIILSYAFVGHACTASMTTLCEEAGISPRTFWRSIALLKERELILVEEHTDHRGRFNRYTPTTRAVRVPVEGPATLAQGVGSDGPVTLALCQESTDGSCQTPPLPSCNEEEDVEEEHPPNPPQAGGTKTQPPAPRCPTSNRDRDRAAYRAALDAWTGEHFPGAEPDAVGAVVGDLPAGCEATPAVVREHAERRGRLWVAMLSPPELADAVLAEATR